VRRAATLQEAVSQLNSEPPFDRDELLAYLDWIQRLDEPATLQVLKLDVIEQSVLDMLAELRQAHEANTGVDAEPEVEQIDLALSALSNDLGLLLGHANPARYGADTRVLGEVQPTAAHADDVATLREKISRFVTKAHAVYQQFGSDWGRAALVGNMAVAGAIEMLGLAGAAKFAGAGIAAWLLSQAVSRQRLTQLKDQLHGAIEAFSSRLEQVKETVEQAARGLYTLSREMVAEGREAVAATGRFVGWVFRPAAGTTHEMQSKLSRSQRYPGKFSNPPINGLPPGVALHFARCCRPVLGDEIIGTLTPGKAVTIHTQDCATLKSFADTPDRWLDVGWDSDAAVLSTSRLRVIAENRPGTLAELASSISEAQGNIRNLRFTSRNNEYIGILIDVEVNNILHLAENIEKIKKNPRIIEVARHSESR
jgi:hypothetical protein